MYVFVQNSYQTKEYNKIENHSFIHSTIHPFESLTEPSTNQLIHINFVFFLIQMCIKLKINFECLKQ